jgi:ribonuclease P protein component
MARPLSRSQEANHDGKWEFSRTIPTLRRRFAHLEWAPHQPRSWFARAIGPHRMAVPVASIYAGPSCRRAGGVSAEEAMGEANVPTEQPQAVEEARLPAPDVDSRRPGHIEGPSSEGPASPVGLIWPIGDRATFAALQSARRVRSGPLTVSFVHGNPAEPPRVAYAIGRKVGGAVVRNRLRRRLRAVVGSLGSQLGPGAYLIGAGPEAVSLSVEELRAIVVQVLPEVGKARLRRATGAKETTR